MYAVLFSTLTTAALGVLVVRATGERLLAERGNVGTARARPNFLLGSFALPGRAQENRPTASCQLPSYHLPTASGQQLPHKHEPLLTASRAKPAGRWRRSIGFGMNYPSCGQPCARWVRRWFWKPRNLQVVRLPFRLLFRTHKFPFC